MKYEFIKMYGRIVNNIFKNLVHLQYTTKDTYFK